ncbi:MAG TPA: hypothetical protein PLE74_07000 [Candidatus Cloacimonadota bacterium]|nr:hypothetical protein [Candidatus Cloacimonadota bacterium]HPT72012.1 hypothetical protein [Candidatus Cloacimonadota bacterium]
MYAPFSFEAMSNFVFSLEVMWKGMLGIFVFMGIFYLLIQAFIKLFPGADTKNT